MEDLISIIVPIYNMEQYLEKCLESIVNQTYKNLEIILIDDGSTDNSGKICDDYAKKDKRIRVIHKENGGVSSARNKGLDIVKGKYVIFFDSDDYIEFNMIESLYKNIQIDDYDVSICNYNIINGSNISPNVILTDKKIFNQKEFLQEVLSKQWNNGYLVNKLIKKSCINDIRFNEDFFIMEDVTFLIEISKNVSKAYLDKDLYLYNYVQQKNSATHIFNEKKYSSMIKAQEQIIPYLDVCDKDTKNAIILDYLFYIMTYYCFCYKNKQKNLKEIKELSLKSRKKYFWKAIDTKYYSFFKKIKLFIISYFPIIYGNLKSFKDKK